MRDESWVILSLEQAARVAFTVFPVNVKVVPANTANTIGPARYDHATDLVEVFTSFVDTFSSQYDDREALITHAVCHEMGHAEESRRFAKGRIFPYGLKIGTRSVQVCIKHEFDITLGENQMNTAMRQVMNGVLDYTIDRELSRHGIQDVAAKSRASQVKGELEKRLAGQAGKAGQDRFNALINIALSTGAYRFGKLTAGEKQLFEDYHNFQDLRNKWVAAEAILESRNFGDVEGLIDAVDRLFYEMFGICVITESHTKSKIEQEFMHRKLPDFWTQGEYALFVLT